MPKISSSHLNTFDALVRQSHQLLLFNLVVHSINEAVGNFHIVIVWLLCLLLLQAGFSFCKVELSDGCAVKQTYV